MEKSGIRLIPADGKYECACEHTFELEENWDRHA